MKMIVTVEAATALQMKAEVLGEMRRVVDRLRKQAKAYPPVKREQALYAAREVEMIADFIACWEIS
jgi:hypothetical protein